MLHTIKRHLKDPFFRNSALFFSASMVVAFLNYLFHPILARVMSLQDFGDIEALIALSSVLSTFMSGFAVATVHASVNCEDKDECAAVIASLRKTALIFILSIFTILVIGSQFFANQLHFSSPLLFIILGLVLVVGALQTFRNGYLQGQRDFKAVSLANIIQSGGRLLLAALFVWIGWHSFGAAIGMLCAQIVSFAYVFLKTRQLLTKHATALGSDRVREELMNVGFFAIATLFVTILYNTDILIVKRFFAPDVAGAYSGISTMANIVYFVTGSFSLVLLSSVKRSDGGEARRRTFFKAVILITAIGGAFVLLCLCFPQFLTGLLMGARYVPYAYLLPWLVLSFFFASLANVCVYFALALRKKGLTINAIVVSLLLAFLVAFRHDSLLQIAQNYLTINVIAVVVMGAFVSGQLKSPKINKTS